MTDREAFDEIFDEAVVQPLAVEGFRREGKSLYMDDGILQFAWMRGSGRLSIPGTLTHIVAFRHSFLRGKAEKLSATAPHAVGDYPWIFSREDLVKSSCNDWYFKPTRLMTPPYGRLLYSVLPHNAVAALLAERRSAFLRYVAYARTLDAVDAHSQIALHAGEYWIARLWDEDYRANLKT